MHIISWWEQLCLPLFNECAQITELAQRDDMLVPAFLSFTGGTG